MLGLGRNSSGRMSGMGAEIESVYGCAGTSSLATALPLPSPLPASFPLLLFGRARDAMRMKKAGGGGMGIE